MKRSIEDVLSFDRYCIFHLIHKEKRFYFDYALKNLVSTGQITKNTGIQTCYELLKLEIAKLSKLPNTEMFVCTPPYSASGVKIFTDIFFNRPIEKRYAMADPKYALEFTDVRPLLCERLWSEILTQSYIVLREYAKQDVDTNLKVYTYKDLLEMIDNNMYIDIYKYDESKLTDDEEPLPEWLTFLYDLLN